jgi:hypothetical protein
MGMWSVYCGASNITINSDQECCIIPLKEEYPKALNWIPQSLPIFGKYNDYGGMYDIVEDDNTKLIEDYFGVTIIEFIEFLVAGEHNRDNDNIKGNLNDIKDWQYMWVNKDVYEFMVKDHSDDDYFISKLRDWRNLRIVDRVTYLGDPFKINYSIWSDPEFLELIVEKSKEFGSSYEKPSSIVMKYFNNLDVFGDRLAGISYLRNNMGVMSNHFKPYYEYITPQCGEYKQHQILLEKFAEINKKYIS